MEDVGQEGSVNFDLDGMVKDYISALQKELTVTDVVRMIKCLLDCHSAFSCGRLYTEIHSLILILPRCLMCTLLGHLY